MHRCSWWQTATFVAVLVVHANLAAWAQESDRSERYFSYLDRDRNGEISTEEFRRLDDRTRERLRERGIDGERGSISKSRFIETYRRLDDSRSSSSSSGSSSSSSSNSSSSRGRSSRTRPKPRLTLTLPPNYQALDVNKDDQVAMYEWDKAKYAEFIALDRNGDGFLTPNELDDPPKITATTAVSAGAGATTPGTTATVTSPATASAAAAVDKPAADESPDTRQAKYFFSITDKDKNGEISTEEWAASRGIRPMFEKASISPALPLKQDAFVQHYLVIKQKK